MSDKYYDIEALYIDLGLDNLQDEVRGIAGEYADNICSAIADLDYEFRQALQNIEEEENENEDF